ncbi:MAG: extracellular solute-binding protein [Phyllobacterium sp.]
MYRPLLRPFFLAILSVQMMSVGHAAPSHGIAMHGEPALPKDFQFLPYVNADAPKGGSIKYGVVGTFDSLNPFILKSMRTTARGLFNDQQFGNLVYESLLQRSQDESFTLYGLLAETVETNPERTWVEFTLNPKAEWSDGQPVTSDDIIFSLELLTEKGRPPFNTRMNKIEKIEKVGDRGVRFSFNENADREFPLILGLMPILPRHAVDRETFGNSSLAIPVGSGPYLVDKVQPGQRITYRRNTEYWAKDLPMKRGSDNYDTITVDYFRSETAQFEAFKKGLFDIFTEGDPTHWEKGYDFPAFKEGRVVKDVFKSETPANIYGFFFNTRRELFADRRVRQALSTLFDFEWTNRNLFAGRYARTAGFWSGSDLSSIGQPANEHERAFLARFPDTVLPDVLDGTYRPTATDGTGRDRVVMKRAMDLLKTAGYRLESGSLVDPDGKPFQFELLTRSVAEERLGLAFKRTLERLGISITVRTVDDAQYQKRLQTFDYDMILGALAASLSPGTEQWRRWGSPSRDMQGSFNYAGVAEPAIDAAIEKMLQVQSTEDFISSVRTLDRLLISGNYVIPLHHLPEQWVARWAYIKHPEQTPLYGYQLPVWWSDKQ